MNREYALTNGCFSVCLGYHVLQQEDKRQLRETSMHPLNSERYVHTFKDITNFSGTINVTYRYLAGTPLPRKSKSASLSYTAITHFSDHFTYSMFCRISHNRIIICEEKTRKLPAGDHQVDF